MDVNSLVIDQLCESWLECVFGTEENNRCDWGKALEEPKVLHTKKLAW